MKLFMQTMLAMALWSYSSCLDAAALAEPVVDRVADRVAHQVVDQIRTISTAAETHCTVSKSGQRYTYARTDTGWVLHADTEATKTQLTAVTLPVSQLQSDQDRLRTDI